VVHGGAGSSPADFTRDENLARREGLNKALQIGAKILREGGASLEAVEQVVRCLEDDPCFNAGRGAVFNAEGEHELDASIMDGRTLACGAVAAVRTAQHPITVARRIMLETPHVLLAGEGADRFVESIGAERVTNRFFDTQRQRAEWERARRAESTGGGTVGCVALDVNGNLAAGTSTGGLTNKLPGRVGDTPIIGAGTYADNESCAVSCTGFGEHFIRHAVAHDVAALVKYRHLTLAEAVNTVLQERLKPGWGGLIAIDCAGNVCRQYTTKGMASAVADSTAGFDIDWDLARSRPE
jgi:beta-aspartyl-peptidase (threonine type)